MEAPEARWEGFDEGTCNGVVHVELAEGGGGGEVVEEEGGRVVGRDHEPPLVCPPINEVEGFEVLGEGEEERDFGCQLRVEDEAEVEEGLMGGGQELCDVVELLGELKKAAIDMAKRSQDWRLEIR